MSFHFIQDFEIGGTFSVFLKKLFFQDILTNFFSDKGVISQLCLGTSELTLPLLCHEQINIPLIEEINKSRSKNAFCSGEVDTVEKKKVSLLLIFFNVTWDN